MSRSFIGNCQVPQKVAIEKWLKNGIISLIIREKNLKLGGNHESKSKKTAG